MGFPCGTVVKNLPANTRDAVSIPGSGRSLGGGNGNPLQYSCLENLTDRGDMKGCSPWGRKSQTRPHTHTHSTKGLRADRQTDVESSVNVFRECWVVARTPCPELTGSNQSLPAPSSPCLQMPLGQSQARSALPLLWVSGPESHLSGPSFLPELGGHLEDSRVGLI